MKIRHFFCRVLFSVLLVTFFPTSCKNSDNPAQTQSSVTQEVVADMIAASLGGSASTNGLSAQMEEAATVAGGAPFPKSAGELDLRMIDTTVVRQGTIGNFSYYYIFHYSFVFSNFGNKLDFNYSMRGTFDTPRIASDDSANASIVITHIIDPDSQYTLNANYLRLGSQSSKVGNRVQFTSTITWTLTDVKISKSSNSINSGTGVITVAGQVSTGGSFNYYATITLLGNQQASLTMNSRVYLINLATGTATLESKP